MHITAKVAAVAPSNQIGHPIKILNTPYVTTADIDAANGLIIDSITTSPTPFGQFVPPQRWLYRHTLQQCPLLSSTKKKICTLMLNGMPNRPTLRVYA